MGCHFFQSVHTHTVLTAISQSLSVHLQRWRYNLLDALTYGPRPPLRCRAPGAERGRSRPGKRRLNQLTRRPRVAEASHRAKTDERLTQQLCPVKLEMSDTEIDRTDWLTARQHVFRARWKAHVWIGETKTPRCMREVRVGPLAVHPKLDRRNFLY